MNVEEAKERVEHFACMCEGHSRESGIELARWWKILILEVQAAMPCYCINDDTLEEPACPDMAARGVKFAYCPSCQAREKIKVSIGVRA